MWGSFFHVYPPSSSLLDALPPSPKKSPDQVSDILKSLAGLQESGQTQSVCVLKERILHIFNLQSRLFSYKSHWRSVPALKAEIKGSQRNTPEECEPDPSAVRNVHTGPSALEEVQPYMDICTLCYLSSCWAGGPACQTFLTCLRFNDVYEFSSLKFLPGYSPQMFNKYYLALLREPA